MQKFRGIILILFCLSLAIGSTLAQSSQETKLRAAEGVARLPWNVGTDLLWLIDKNTLPSTTLFVKRNVQPENKKPGALRMRVGLGFDTIERSLTSGQPSLYEAKGFDILTRLGYEWQIQRGKHQIFYGSDLHLEYNYRYTTVYVPETQAKDEVESRNWNIGPVVFIGYQFFLTSQISFSTEATYGIIYGRDWNSQKTSFPNTPDIDNVETVNNTWNSKIIPLYVINFHFHF